MSGTRYLALIARSPGARSAWEQASAAALRAHPGFEKQLAGDRLALLSEAGAALALGREGFVIGTIHERGRAAALRAFDPETVRAVIASSGEWLIRAHWGSYVALIAARERDSLELVRAPLGELSCFVVESVFGLFVASDVDLLQRFADYDPQIDWNGLARQLAAGDLCGRRTCLIGVEELSGGERLIDRAGERSIDEPWRIARIAHHQSCASEIGGFFCLSYQRLHGVTRPPCYGDDRARRPASRAKDRDLHAATRSRSRSRRNAPTSSNASFAACSI